MDGFGTVFLGLTTGCARCHDHKFDPIKQKDYYQLFAFFNNLDGPALDGNAALPPPVVKVPTPEQAAALAKLDEKGASLQKTIADEAARVVYDADTDGRTAAEPPAPTDFVWIDDDLPPGAQPSPEGGFNHAWQFVAGPDHPVLSGKKSSMQKVAGLGQHFFTGANPGLRCGAGDRLFAYVYLDPTDPPREIMLQWNTGEWKHRAYWGENLIEFGKDKTTERVHLGPLPKPGELGAAGGGRRQGGDQTGPGRQRLGLHAVRRHGLLGQGRRPDADAAGRRAVLRLPDGMDADAEGARRRVAAEGDPGYRQERPGEAERRSEEAAARLFRRPTPIPGVGDTFAPLLAAGRRGRKGNGRVGQAGTGDAGIQGASGPQTRPIS